MGLDMWLSKKYFIWSEDRKKIKITGLKVPVNPEKLQYVEEEVIIWRKSNQIHNWFVKNCQKGEDNCAIYFVPIEKLKELLKLIEYVLKNRNEAEELLPTQSGFFFGSEDYDEYYWGDLEETRVKLTELLAKDNTNWEFYYQSSW